MKYNPLPTTTLTIRNVDAALKQQLRLRAAQHGRSMEEELRSILAAALAGEPDNALNLVDDELDGPPMPTEAEIKAALSESEADIAAGRIVDMASLLAKMRTLAEGIRQERLTTAETLQKL